MWHVMCYMLHVMCDMLVHTCDMFHVTCYICYVKALLSMEKQGTMTSARAVSQTNVIIISWLQFRL